MARYHVAALAIMAVLLAACAGSGASPTPPGETDDGASPAPIMPVGAVPDSLLEQILADAANRTGVDRGAISVTVAEAVTWSDGSLGCPQPGFGYTQALVPGYRVILDVSGDELAYHASEAGEFLPCDNPQEPLPAGGD